MNYLIKISLSAVFVFSNAVFSQTVSVERVSFELPRGEWKKIASKEGSLKLDGSTALAAKTTTDSFGYIQNNMLRAVLTVTATRGGMGMGGRIRWTTQCNSGANSFAVNLEKGFENLNCAIATGPLNSEVYLNNIIPDIKNIMATQDVKIAPRMTSTRAVSGNSTGTYLLVNLTADSKFTGSTNPAVYEGLPANIKAANVAWAEELSAAVKDSVNSFKGGLTLPAINWAN
jgi:hypothetical protein